MYSALFIGEPELMISFNMYRFANSRLEIGFCRVGWHSSCVSPMAIFAYIFSSLNLFVTNASQEISNLAVSLSTNTIKLYSPITGQYFGECRGHSGTIHEISFPEPLSPQAICSCSSDGTIRTWDIRTFNQVWLLQLS